MIATVNGLSLWLLDNLIIKILLFNYYNSLIIYINVYNSICNIWKITNFIK